MLNAHLPSSDLAICRRPDDKRLFVSLPGRYLLADRTNTRGESRLFACRAVNISTRAMALAAPVTSKVGVPVIVEIDQLGRLRGLIIRVFKLGFAMSVAASDAERAVLGARIDWLEKLKNLEVTDARGHPRFIPRRSHSLLTLANGSIVPCLVIDISASGAAISTHLVPKIGTVLAVGKVVARVVRHFAGGFALQFVTLQDRQEVEALVVPR
jgi:hypothetical protein